MKLFATFTTNFFTSPFPTSTCTDTPPFIAKLSFEVLFIGFGLQLAALPAFYDTNVLNCGAIAVLPPFPCHARRTRNPLPVIHLHINLEHVIMFANTFKLCTYINGAALFLFSCGTHGTRPRCIDKTHATNSIPPSSFHLSFISLSIFSASVRAAECAIKG